MSKGTRRRFWPEYKEQSVARLSEPGVTLGGVAAELGITPTQLKTSLDLTVIHARERGEPENRARIDWKLITNLPVRSRGVVVEKLSWYTMRWKIEVFHKILKSGCRAEEAKLRTAERLVKLIAVFCIMSWRIFWMTMLTRSAPNAPPEAALTSLEVQILDRLVPDKCMSKLTQDTLVSIGVGKWLLRNFGAASGDIHAAMTRARSRSSFARPYIWRFTSLSLVIWPSVCPFDQGSLRAA